MTRHKKDVQFLNNSLADEKIQYNLRIFDRIEKNPKRIKEDILISETKLNPDTVHGYLNSAEAKGLLRKESKTNEYTIPSKDNSKMILGVGFHDNQCIVNAVNLKGEVVEKERFSVRSSSVFNGKASQIENILEEIARGSRFADKGFCFAGISIPFDLEKNNPKNVILLSEGLSRIFRCNVCIVTEAVSSGYCEMKNLPVGTDSFLYMHSDIGIGVVIKNEMIFEAGETSSENERKYLRPWTQFSVVSTAKDLVAKGIGTAIVDKAKGRIDAITLETVLEAAGEGDELALDLVKRAAFALGVRTAYLANIFMVDKIIVGGGVEKKESDFLDHVKGSTKRFLLKNSSEKLEIVPGRFGEEAASIGAALVCRRQLFMEV